MAWRLKDRLVRFPNTIVFVDPATGFKSIPGTSFSKVVSGVIMMRTANPAVTKQHNLATKPADVENEVESYFAQRCSELGWTDFIIEGGALQQAPFQRGQSVGAKLQNLAGGAAVSVAWLESGEQAVPVDQSTARAKVCSECPLNGKGGLEAYFTRPAQLAVQKMLEQRLSMKLSTPYDDRLGTCTACLCPLLLKVHTPFNIFYPKMTEQAKNDLHPSCWIISESKKP